jgi:hypothetical protein
MPVRESKMAAKYLPTMLDGLFLEIDAIVRAAADGTGAAAFGAEPAGTWVGRMLGRAERTFFRTKRQACVNPHGCRVVQYRQCTADAHTVPLCPACI